MKIIDTDVYFEKYIKQYMLKNKGKFTEEEWEDKIPMLYEKFAKTPLEVFEGKSPEEYYSKFSGEELVEALKKHISDGVPVSDLLCEAIVRSDAEDALLSVLTSESNNELISYAVNALMEKHSKKALPVYAEKVVAEETADNLREIMGEALIDMAQDALPILLKIKDNAGKGKCYIAEALARGGKSDEIFNYLCDLFKTEKELAYYGAILEKYGDERAVDVIKSRIKEPWISYADYIELKNDIEALGGEWEDDRDFTTDASYIKIKGLS